MRSSRTGFNPYRYFLRNPPPNIPRAEVPAPPALGAGDPRFTVKTPSVQCLPALTHVGAEPVSEQARQGAVVPIRCRFPRYDSRGFLFAIISGGR